MPVPVHLFIKEETMEDASLAWAVIFGRFISSTRFGWRWSTLNQLFGFFLKRKEVETLYSSYSCRREEEEDEAKQKNVIGRRVYQGYRRLMRETLVMMQYKHRHRSWLLECNRRCPDSPIQRFCQDREHLLDYLLPCPVRMILHPQRSRGHAPVSSHPLVYHQC